MERPLKLFPLFGSALCLGLGLSACQQVPLAEPVAPVVPLSGEAAKGEALARASCAGCHGVARYRTSPNPSAPSFAAIANQEGLTAATLSTWLRDAHNYPGEMQVQLDARQVDDLVAYMLTLQDPNYRPPIS